MLLFGHYLQIICKNSRADLQEVHYLITELPADRPEIQPYRAQHLTIL